MQRYEVLQTLSKHSSTPSAYKTKTPWMAIQNITAHKHDVFW